MSQNSDAIINIVNSVLKNHFSFVPLNVAIEVAEELMKAGMTLLNREEA